MTTDADIFEFYGGLHLRDSVLWLDSPTARPLCFISSAGVPGAQGHHKIVSTELTAKLLRAQAAVHGRGSLSHEPRALITPYHRPFKLGNLTLELLPAGHVLGSASLSLQHQGKHIVYTGDFSPRPTPLAVPLQVPQCNLLALACRFNRRRHSLPPQEQTAQALVRFVSDAVDHGCTAVVFCAPLGEAQQVALTLQQAGLPVAAHRQIAKLSAIHCGEGLPLQRVGRYDGVGPPPPVLLWPLRLRRSPTIQRLPQLRTAFASGLALDAENVYQMCCDATFALSAQADYGETLQYVRACNPDQVVLVSDSAGELAQDLGALGLRVRTLAPASQLQLF